MSFLRPFRNVAIAIISFLFFECAAKADIHMPGEPPPGQEALMTSPDPAEQHFPMKASSDAGSPVMVKIIPDDNTESDKVQELDAEKSVAKWTHDLFLATLALATVTALLWLATLTAIWQQRSKDQKQLRAYIAVSGVRVEDQAVVVEYLNYGQTPALNLQVGLSRNENAQTKEQILKSPVTAKDLLVPPSEPPMFARYAMNESGTLVPFHLAGVVFYSDVFGSKHHLSFQYKCVHGGAEWRSIPIAEGTEFS